MHFEIGFDVEIHATATSSYSDEVIDRRLADLRNRADGQDAKQEIEYLERLKAKRKSP